MKRRRQHALEDHGFIERGNDAQIAVNEIVTNQIADICQPTLLSSLLLRSVPLPVLLPAFLRASLASLTFSTKKAHKLGVDLMLSITCS